MSETTAEKLLTAAFEAGFAASLIPVDQMVFVPEYRQYCEENLCGNYNKNYACPPYCGTPQEMEARTKDYSYAMVLQSRAAVVNAMDPVETAPLKKMHNQKTRELLRKCRKEILKGDYLAILAGPCNLCSSCRVLEQLPCPMEKERYSCLSAYCIDVARLADTAGLELSWSADQASFFSIVLFN